MDNALIAAKTAKCIYQPNPEGNTGLEGYQLNDTYKAEFVTFPGKVKKSYWRVFPSESDPTYYETCSTKTFNKHFQGGPASKDHVFND